jgi:hypothetical protein
VHAISSRAGSYRQKQKAPTRRSRLGIDKSTKTEGASNLLHLAASTQHTHTRQHLHPLTTPTSFHYQLNSQHQTSCAPEESAATLPALTASTRPSKKSCVSRKAPLLSAVLGSGCSSTSFPIMTLALVSSVLRPTSARWLCRMVVSTRKTSLSDGDKVCLRVDVLFRDNC